MNRKTGSGYFIASPEKARPAQSACRSAATPIVNGCKSHESHSNNNI